MTNRRKQRAPIALGESPLAGRICQTTKSLSGDDPSSAVYESLVVGGVVIRAGWGSIKVNGQIAPGAAANVIPP